MALEFVIETPQKRGINRNNNKLIQKRATQAGARTRLNLKYKSIPGSGAAKERPLRDFRPKNVYQEAHDEWLLANAGLVSSAYPPFFSRFGESGRLMCAPGPSETAPTQISTYPVFSVLQNNLLIKLASQTNITTDANRVFKIFNLSQTHVLGHLPSRYGQIVFLDDAMECLIARLHDYLPLLRLKPSDEKNDSQSYLYVKALCSLRTAIDRNVEVQTSEIWFATLLLTLSELLAGADDPGWIWHAAGAARLLYKIGPEQIRSEFQLSLLAAQCKVMVIETIISNKPCYLADASWQAALERTILNDDVEFGTRSRCSIELWSLGARIPTLFQYVADHVYQRPQCRYAALKNALERLVAHFAVWKETWYIRLQDTIKGVPLEIVMQHNASLILSTYCMLLIVAHRLQIALDPWKDAKLELRVLEICAEVFHLRGECAGSRQKKAGQPWSVYSQVASGTEMTTRGWYEQVFSAMPEKPINACVFDEWCSAIGRDLKPFSFSPCWSPESSP